MLRGCPIGRLTQDPDVVADPALRSPVEQALAAVQGLVADVVREGQAAGELDRAADPDEVAAAVVAVLQGGYVLARAAGSPRPFDQAVAGVLVLLRGIRASGRRPRH